MAGQRVYFDSDYRRAANIEMLKKRGLKPSAAPERHGTANVAPRRLRRWAATQDTPTCVGVARAVAAE